MSRYIQVGEHIVYHGDSIDDRFTRYCRSLNATFSFADPPYGFYVEKWDSRFYWQHDYLLDVSPIVAVTPGIANLQLFLRQTDMPYKYAIAYYTPSSTARSLVGYSHWICATIFSRESVYHEIRDHQVIHEVSDKRYNHSAKKPLEMMIHLIESFTAPGDTVIDPFLGSGTTLIACQKTGRYCVGAELSDSYIEMVQQRYNDHVRDSNDVKRKISVFPGWNK